RLLPALSRTGLHLQQERSLAAAGVVTKLLHLETRIQRVLRQRLPWHDVPAHEQGSLDDGIRPSVVQEVQELRTAERAHRQPGGPRWQPGIVARTEREVAEHHLARQHE